MARAEAGAEHEVKRRAILDGAARVFYRRGFAAGTTREIAAEVGLTQPAIYHYVGSKSDLLREIAWQVDQDMMIALAAGLRSGSDPAQKLRGVIREFTAAVVRDQHAFAVFWQEHHSLPGETRDRIVKDERAFMAQVGELIAELQEAGRMPAGPVTLLAEAIMSMPSWMYHWYRRGGSLQPEQIADLYCQLIGLDAEASKERSPR